MADDIALLGGFRRPVFDAQATFRLLMTAMAQPGKPGNGDRYQERSL